MQCHVYTAYAIYTHALEGPVYTTSVNAWSIEAKHVHDHNYNIIIIDLTSILSMLKLQ